MGSKNSKNNNNFCYLCKIDFQNGERHCCKCKLIYKSTKNSSRHCCDCKMLLIKGYIHCHECKKNLKNECKIHNTNYCNNCEKYYNKRWEPEHCCKCRMGCFYIKDHCCQCKMTFHSFLGELHCCNCKSNYRFNHKCNCNLKNKMPIYNNHIYSKYNYFCYY